MKVQRTWATLFGMASMLIGTFKLFALIPLPISSSDAIIHFISGAIYIGGAWSKNGKQIQKVNLWLGFFYALFGIFGLNLPHLLAGAISMLISLIPVSEEKIPR